MVLTWKGEQKALENKPVLTLSKYPCYKGSLMEKKFNRGEIV